MGKRRFGKKKRLDAPCDSAEEKIKFGRKILALKLREYYNNPQTDVDSSSTTNFSM
ncbi:hypothetical protein P9597_27975 [Aneurinibacillus migulanus]|uniref:hypothetical protein n=1 Tax=Aneurinibacillus migulanus TaxID=47500 RepID=UPI002E1EC281|nr:hypothetical protein [Aneurinibacillus migulanus]